MLPPLSVPPRLVPAGLNDLNPLACNNTNNSNNPRLCNAHKTPRYPRINIYIATLNTRTLRTEESLTELESALQALKWDIIGISEMRRLGESIEDRYDYIMYYKGEIAGHRGVGFLVKASLKKNILEFIGISDRVAVLNINLPHYKKDWTIIQAYAPTEQATLDDVESFYTCLSDTIRNHANRNLVVMGDFNAQLGSKLNEEEKPIGNFGHGKRSKNGQKFLEFLLENNLFVLNTLYKKNAKSKWTWISPDGKYRNEIDYITTNHPKAFTDTGVIQNLNFNTNHRMVRSSLRVYPLKKSRKHIIPHESVQISKEGINELNAALLSSLDDASMYEKMEHILTQNKTHMMGKHKKKYIMSEQTLQLIQDRRHLSSQDKKRYHKEITELSKKINVNVRKDRKCTRLKTIEHHITKTGGVRKALVELKDSKKEWIPKMKRKNKTVTKRTDIMGIATEYFKQLYSNSTTNTHCSEKLFRSQNELESIEKEPKILEMEVRKAIKKQKLEKAPGPDNIRNELLHSCIDSLSPLLAKCFDQILTTGEIPEQWTISHIILLHKKGDKDDIGNYRPISLMSNIYKVFSKVILERISKQLDENQPKEQAGFRRNFSTIDHIHTLKQVIEKYREYGKPLYLAFIDYSKAFDSLEHDKIWTCLEKQGISKIYTNILRRIYDNSKAKIQLESLGKEIPIKRGVRQGDPVSPKIFSAVLEDVFRKINWSTFGLRIDGENLNHLRFADDIVLFEESPEKLEIMVQQLSQESAAVGLSMNIDKTKVMTNSTMTNITVDGKTIDYVDEYIYLGQIISPTDLTTKEIDRRIANGWRKYWALKEIMKSRDLGLSLKSKVFNVCVLPCLTYGCETWALNANHRMKLAKCQRAMERSMVGVRIKDRLNSQLIRRQTKVIDILTKIDTQKWRWAGHSQRDRHEKWSKIITNWYPRDGKRNRGRPCRRWEDEIKQTAGPNWRRVAHDRTQWRELEEAFANRQSELRDII